MAYLQGAMRAHTEALGAGVWIRDEAMHKEFYR
jgi:hypothetical protein